MSNLTVEGTSSSTETILKSEHTKVNVTDEITLQQLRKLIPKSAQEPPVFQNILGFVIKFGAFAACFYLACASSSILLTSVWTFLAGVWIFSLGTVGHDCGHGSYVRPRWLNEFIGQASMIMNGMPYGGWKHSHNVHHANTNFAHNDPDRLWLYEDEFLAMSSVGRYLWKLFHTRLFWLSAVGHYFRSILPWAFQIKQKTDQESIIKGCQQDIAIFFAVLGALHGSMYALGFGFKSVFVHFFAILIGFACLSVYVRTEHYLLTNGYDVAEKPWLTSRTITQNPFLDFLATNLNYHIEHHILQTIPHANLPSIRPLMKETILKANAPYHEDELFPFLKRAFNQEFFVLERETFKEIPISQLYQRHNKKVAV